MRRRGRPLVVGLTGGVGCGKSVIAAELGRRGAVVISGDDVGHDVVKQNAALQRRLAQAFGEDVLDARGVRRRRLAQRAFASPEGFARLNALVHPALVRELRRRLRRACRDSAAPMIVVDAALLVEWGGRVPVDVLVAVWASRKNRQLWLRRRGWSLEEIAGRMRFQTPFSARQAVADLVIRNDGARRELRRKARQLWQKLSAEH